MKSRAISTLFLFVTVLPVWSAPEIGSRPEGAPSLSQIPLGVACIAGGSLALYGLYTWMYGTSTWTSAGIKKETEDLLRAAPAGKGARIEWRAVPVVTKGLPRKRAMVTVQAMLAQGHNGGDTRWVIYDNNVVESDNPRRDLAQPGLLKVLWKSCYLSLDSTLKYEGSGEMQSLGR